MVQSQESAKKKAIKKGVYNLTHYRARSRSTVASTERSCTSLQ
jgi:hypothetical protein